MRRTLHRLTGPVLVPVLVLALGLLGYDAGSRAAAAHRALHGEGRTGTFVVEACGPRGCVGSFVSAGRGWGQAIIEGRYRPGERVPAVLVGGRAWPRKRSTWLYPAAVAVVAVAGLAGVVGYGVVRPLLRRRCQGRASPV